MGFIFYLAIVALFTLSCLMLLRTPGRGPGNRWENYCHWVNRTTDDLFLPITDIQARRGILACTAVFALLGFLFPGNMEGLSSYIIHSAVQANLQGNHQAAWDMLHHYYDSDSPLVHNEIGVTLMAEGNYEGAEAEFERAIKLFPEYTEAHANLALAYSIQGKGNEASFEMRKAKSLTRYPIDPARLYTEEGGMGNLLARIIFMVLFGTVGLLLPRFILSYLKKRRIKLFDELLPEGLIMGTNGLRAGMSLGQVIQLLAEKAPNPVNQEFSLIVKQQQLGKPFNEAMADLARRIPSDDANILVNSVAILRDSGGNLTEVFETLAYTIRERKMIKQKIVSMTAEGRAQGVILTLLPIGMGYLLNKLNPEVFGLMFTTPLGWLLIIGSVIWGAIGVFMMWKIVQIKV